MQDAIIILGLLNFVMSLGGFAFLYLKLSERQARTETHIFHIMRKLDMRTRAGSRESAGDDLTGYSGISET